MYLTLHIGTVTKQYTKSEAHHLRDVACAEELWDLLSEIKYVVDGNFDDEPESVESTISVEESRGILRGLRARYRLLFSESGKIIFSEKERMVNDITLVKFLSQAREALHAERNR